MLHNIGLYSIWQYFGQRMDNQRWNCSEAKTLTLKYNTYLSLSWAIWEYTAHSTGFMPNYNVFWTYWKRIIKLISSVLKTGARICLFTNKTKTNPAPDIWMTSDYDLQLPIWFYILVYLCFASITHVCLLSWGCRENFLMESLVSYPKSLMITYFGNSYAPILCHHLFWRTAKMTPCEVADILIDIIEREMSNTSQARGRL